MPHNFERKYNFMKTFIVSTKMIIAKNIACKALKAADNNDVTHGLYKKACMDGGKIVITNIAEMQAWQTAISAYKAANTTEGKVLRVLKRNATLGLKSRLDAATTPATAA